MKTFAFVDSESHRTHLVHACDVQEARKVVTYHLQVMGGSSVETMDWEEALEHVSRGGKGGKEFLIFETEEQVWTSSTPSVARFLDGV